MLVVSPEVAKETNYNNLQGLENWQKWSDVGEAIKVNRPAILKMFGDLRYNFADFCDAKCYEPSVSNIFK